MAPHARARVRGTLFVRMLLLYTATVVCMQWGVYVYAPGRAPQHARWPRALGAQAARAAPARKCVDRAAVYYAPRQTEPRVEDFDFLLHACGVWRAAAHSALLVVLSEAHLQLERACSAHAHCRVFLPPLELLGASARNHSATLPALLRSLGYVHELCPAEGVAVYAPAHAERGASLDSRVLAARARPNASSCLDAGGEPCMAFAWRLL